MNDLLQILELEPSADIAQAERRFMDIVKQRIQSVSESYDEKAVAAEEQWLRNLHGQFFPFVLKRAAERLKDKDRPKDHPDAAKLKTEAKKTVEALQKNIVEFALCYMHLNRFLTLLRDEIKREEIRTSSLTSRNIKWTADAGTIISRYQKEKKQIVADIARMKSSRTLLEQIEHDMITVRGHLAILCGRENGETLHRRLTAALRTADFKKARSIATDIEKMKKKFGLDQKAIIESETAITTLINRLIETVSSNTSILKGPYEKLFLRPIETDIAYNVMVQDMKKIRGFLAKYHLPYMEYKLDTLFHLKDKLLVVGSMESLMTLYLRLINGIAGPLPDLREVRLFESEVLGRITYLLQGQFEEVPKILARARETVQEFRDGRQEFEDTEKINLEEVAIAPDAAVAEG